MSHNSMLTQQIPTTSNGNIISNSALIIMTAAVSNNISNAVGKNNNNVNVHYKIAVNNKF